MANMTQITRRAKIRALKSYGLRARGLKLREIEPHLTTETNRARVMRGVRIVVRWHNVRRRRCPRAACVIAHNHGIFIARY